MKNLSSTLLQRGNLTARERFLLLIQNDVHKAKTGKEILTAADKEALENWKARNDSEAREWNRLNEAWKQSGRMEIEVEFFYKDAEIAYLANLPILMKLLYYPSYYRMGKCIETLKKIKTVELDQAVKIADKQREIKMKDGLDFDYALYQLAFERLSEADRKRMNELYADIETDHQYLDQEEIIANLYNGKKELTSEAKDRLASLVAERSYNRFAKEYQLFHYFACIPLIEVARYFLKIKGVEIKGKAVNKNQEADDEDSDTCDDVSKVMKAYAAEHNISIQDMLKEGCLKGLDDGLLDSYTPLVVSNERDLLKRWLKAKVEAKTLLQAHINKGELKIRERTNEERLKDKLYSKRLYDSESLAARKAMENIGLEITEKAEIDEKKAFEKFEETVITGESLYNSKEKYAFIKEFRERVDEYDANLGLVYADNDPEQKEGHLDQELLVSNLNKDGKPNFFSMYHMSVTILSNLFEGKTYFEEVEEEGEMFIKFKDMEIEKIFMERRDMLIDGYAKLLAFEGVFKKLSKIYETDLTDHVAERMKVLRLDIEQHNQAIRIATNTDADQLEKSHHSIFRNKEILKFKEDPTISIDMIKPDENATKAHEVKLREILGDL